jgi:tetratricopeptide (TPR) repeat protein
MIDRLIPALPAIAGNFEEFGGKLLDHLLRTPLEHSGVNYLGLPVSSVLDSTSDDGAVVAQYSSERDYFASGMQKASADIDKALSRRPNATRILLIAAEKKRPIVADDFKKRVLAESRMKGRSIGILGAQAIAGLIVRKLLFNDAAIEELSQYLPVLAELRDEAARDRLFPKLRAQHSSRPYINADISQRLAITPCLVLTGIGGSGKSEAATAFGVANVQQYHLRIWLEPEEYRGAAALHGMPLLRGGAKRNIANLLKRQRCLLVIDDPSTDIEQAELAALCGSGSHVLVTARASVAGEYRMPPLDAQEGELILNRNVEELCPPEILSKVWATVGGHPLSLALMNAAIRNGATWEDLALDCREVGQLADPRQRLADRLLDRYRSVLRHELSFFRWARQPECDYRFARVAIMPVGIRKLNERALTSSDRPTAVRLHDVVFASLSSLDWWRADEDAHWNDVLECYLAKASVLNDLSFRTAALSLRNRLFALVNSGDRRPAYVLALLEVTNPESSEELDVEDPVDQAKAISAAGHAVDPLLIREIIETFEWQYLRAKHAGADQASVYVNRGLGLFADLLHLPALTSRQCSEIRHHFGKALAWANRHEEAWREFEAVLASDEPLDASRLQLMRGYKREGENDKAIALGEEVISAAEAHPGDISPTLLLAVLQAIPWREEAARERILRPRQDLIVRTIVDNAEAGLEQAYGTLAAVARYWSQESPDVLENILKAVPRPDIARFESDEARAEFGDVMFEYGRSLGSEGGAPLQVALDLFESSASLSQFHEQRRAELLIELGRADEAERLLRARGDLETNCWVQRLMALALARQSKSEEASIWIDRALDDEACSSRFHEFWDLRFQIRVALGQVDASDDLRAAISLAPAGPIRDRLLARAEVLSK